jgi:predicted acetyltransferase
LSEEADVRLDIAALGSLYMGGFAASLLAAGGRVEELKSGRLAAADALFTTLPSPRSGTAF